MRLEDQAAAPSPAEVVALLGERQAAQAERAQHLQRIAALEEKAADLQRQVDWFKRQLFGRKSERRLLEPDAQQLPLQGMLTAAEAPPPPTETVTAYQRRSRLAPAEDAPDESGLRFDSSVPIEVIELPNPNLTGLREHACAVGHRPLQKELVRIIPSSLAVSAGSGGTAHLPSGSHGLFLCGGYPSYRRILGQRA